MSEERLEQALEEMRREAVSDGALDDARARVWNVLGRRSGQAAGVAGSSCAEFRPDLPAYVNGTLGGSRRVLMDDHLSRCTACRASMADLRGERRVVAMPARSSARWTRWGSLAAAALAMTILYAGRGTIDRLMAPGGPRATIVSIDGGVHRLAGGTFAVDATIGDGEILRTGPGAHAVLRLADGSTVDVNERTELFATAAWSGTTIHLQRGDLIVQAAQQRRGHLRVLTRDSIASVKGTVFAVSTGLGGSLVSVVEGSVAVNQPGTDVLLRPGQQAASNRALAGSIEEAISWSPDAAHYLALLGSVVNIERQLAEQLPVEQRTTSAMLPSLPAGVFAYGAIPNLNGRIGLALVLADQQSAENAAFGAWWNSEPGRLVRTMVSRLQSVSWLLGDEIVFSASNAGAGREIPFVMARVQPGKRADLAHALDALFADTGEPALPYSVSDDLMVVTSSPTDLTWVLGHLGQGAGSRFAAAIDERYRRGTGWLMGIDAPAVIAMAAKDDAPPVELAAMIGMKYVFVEQRAPLGAEENEITLLFDDARTGMASWLADTGSGGAAEYLPAESLVAGYVSMRQPWQLFQEFTALMTADKSFAESLAEVESKLDSGFIANLTGAMGGDAAFALNGVSVSGPRWVMAVEAYNPSTIDSSLRNFVDALNAQLAPDEQHKRVDVRQESAAGRVWNTLTGGGIPFGVSWTYDGGYMVAASDRATAERSIASRSAGSPLVWSQTFRSQLPASAGVHPSAFVWVNTRGAFEALSTLAPSPAAANFLSARDPVLVVFDVKTDQVHAASRTRLSGVILDAMVLESLGGARQGAPSGAVAQ
jgi:hypothetical protein